MNVGEILQRVQRQFGDESGVQINDQDVIRWINDAQREATTQNKFIHMASSIVASVANQQSYNLPTDLADIMSVKFKASGTNSFNNLQWVSKKFLDEYVDNWEGTDYTGDPFYFVRGKSEGTIRVFPVPDSSTGQFEIEYGRYCTDIAIVTDIPDLPVYLHPYIIEYCLMKAYEMDEEWEAADRKAAYLQSTLDANANRDNEGKQTYPTVVTTSEDYV